MRKIKILIFILFFLFFLLSFLIFPIFFLKKEGEGQQIFPRSFTLLLPQKKNKNSISFGEKAGVAIFFSPEGKEKILYQKNPYQKLPPASLTKLMTAMIVLDHYDLSQKVEISYRAVWTEGQAGRLKPGEEMKIEDLLKLMLLVSSNDAATALEEVAGEDKFKEWIKKKEKEIGLQNTNFLNPHGLYQKEHLSCAYDLAKMTYFSLVKYKKLWEILRKKEEIVIGEGPKRKIFHYAYNTNKLLDLENVLGGKTGYLPEVGESMILALKSFGKTKGYVVLVLIGVDDRIQKMKKFYSYIKNEFLWE